jgi:hypothetical protein
VTASGFRSRPARELASKYGKPEPAKPRDTNMFSKTEIALSAAIILTTAFSASAATAHRHAFVHRPAIYNMVHGYNLQTYPDSNDPRSAGGGSLGYNQMLLNGGF